MEAKPTGSTTGVFISTAVAFLVLVGGGWVPGVFLGLSLKFGGGVPWFAPLSIAWLWLFWQYCGGRWAPVRNSARRHRLRRARALPVSVWRWALLFGATWIAALTTLTYTVARFTKIGIGLPAVVAGMPAAGLAVTIVVISVTAALSEEVAFRGYMQVPLEDRFGAPLGVGIVSVLFTLSHLGGVPVTSARLALILFAAIGYGVIARTTDSILPGIVLHAVGDSCSFTALWWAHARGLVAAPPSPQPLVDLNMWRYALATLVLLTVAGWAFRRLRAARAATNIGS